jgi:hypothetical protein
LRSARSAIAPKRRRTYLCIVHRRCTELRHMQLDFVQLQPDKRLPTRHERVARWLEQDARAYTRNIAHNMLQENPFRRTLSGFATTHKCLEGPVCGATRSASRTSVSRQGTGARRQQFGMKHEYVKRSLRNAAAGAPTGRTRGVSIPRLRADETPHRIPHIRELAVLIAHCPGPKTSSTA